MVILKGCDEMEGRKCPTCKWLNRAAALYCRQCGNFIGSTLFRNFEEKTDIPLIACNHCFAMTAEGIRCDRCGYIHALGWFRINGIDVVVA